MGTALCVIFVLALAFLLGAATMYLVNRNNKKIINCLDDAVVNGQFDLQTAKKIKAILNGETGCDC